MRPHILLVPAILASLVASSAAQQKDDPVVTLRAQSRLILVPAFVSEHGKAVSALHKQDFTILCDGKPVEARIFEELDAQSDAPLTPLPPHTASNFVDGDKQNGITIVLLDMLNSSVDTRFKMVSFVRQDLPKLLRTSRVPVSLLVLTSTGLRQIASFTAEPSAVAQEIVSKEAQRNISTLDSLLTFGVFAADTNSQQPGATSGTDSGLGAPSSGVDPATALASVSSANSMRVENTANITAEAFRQIAHAFAGIPGRKKLVWFSTGFPQYTDGSDLFSHSIQPEADGADVTHRQNGQDQAAFLVEDARRNSAHVLSNANIAVYPVDINGATNPSWQGRQDPSNFGGAQLRGFSVAEKPQFSRESNQQSMVALAQETGGLLCTDFLSTCLEHAEKDADHYYLLGFYQPASLPAGWHKLEVKTNHAGAVRARNGFTVDPPAKPGMQLRDLQDAMASPIDGTAIPIVMQVLPKDSNNGKRATIDITVAVPPGPIKLEDDSKLKLDLYVEVSRVGSPRPEFRNTTVRKTLTPAQAQLFRTEGFRYKNNYELPPGKYQVRLLLRDNTSGRIGSVTTPVEIAGDTSLVKRR